jgi:MinD superfamily P-loop ATPase
VEGRLRGEGEMTTKAARKIVSINEERCNGCGACVPACAEGALQIVDGKAKLVSETFCEGGYPLVVTLMNPADASIPAGSGDDLRVIPQ